VKRREFILALGGAAAWPLTARAQQGERMRRIGVLMPLTADDAEAMARITIFVQALQELGWTAGRNRWAANAERIGPSAADLVALAPDVILSTGSPATAALQQATRTVPIVFVAVTDPVGAAFVDSLAQPGGNVTGFTSGEFPMSGKWLELLKEIAPGVTRVAVLRDASIATAIAQLGVLQSAARRTDGRSRSQFRRARRARERTIALPPQWPRHEVERSFPSRAKRPVAAGPGGARDALPRLSRGIEFQWDSHCRNFPRRKGYRARK
jgi:hypothetical protein